MKKIKCLLPIATLALLCSCDPSLPTISAYKPSKIVNALSNNLRMTGYYLTQVFKVEDLENPKLSIDQIKPISETYKSIENAYSDGKYFESDKYYENYYRRDDKNKVCAESINLKGTVDQEFLPKDWTGRFLNPFVQLKEDDLEKIDNHFYNIKEYEHSEDVTIRETISRALLGSGLPSDVKVNTFGFVIKGGNLDCLKIEWTFDSETKDSEQKVVKLKTNKKIEVRFDNRITTAYTLPTYTKAAKTNKKIIDAISKVKGNNFTLTKNRTLTADGSTADLTPEVYKITEDGFSVKGHDSTNQDKIEGIAKYPNGNYYKYSVNTGSTTPVTGQKVDDYQTQSYLYRPSYDEINLEILEYTKEEDWDILEKNLRNKYLNRVAGCYAISKYNSNDFRYAIDDNGYPLLKVSTYYESNGTTINETISYSDIGSTTLDASGFVSPSEPTEPTDPTEPTA